MSTRGRVTRARGSAAQAAAQSMSEPVAASAAAPSLDSVRTSVIAAAFQPLVRDTSGTSASPVAVVMVRASAATESGGDLAVTVTGQLELNRSRSPPIQLTLSASTEFVPPTPPSLLPPQPPRPMLRACSTPDRFAPPAWPDFLAQPEREDQPQLQPRDKRQPSDRLNENRAPTEVTVVQHKSTSRTAHEGAGILRHSVTRAVRLVLLNTPTSGCASAYVHLLDLLRLILKPFSTVPLTLANITPKAYFKQVAHHLIQLADEDIEVQLTRSSTTTISMRSHLLSLAGLRQLLTHPTIRTAVTDRVAIFGDSLETFLHSTLINSMLVMNHGPQPQPGEPEQVQPRRRPSRKRTTSKPPRVTNDEDSDSSTGEGGEYEPHCLIDHSPLDGLYYVHWRTLEGDPWPAGKEGACTWEREETLASCTEVFNRFKAGNNRCPVHENWKLVQKRQAALYEQNQRGRSQQLLPMPASASALPLSDQTQLSAASTSPAPQVSPRSVTRDPVHPLSIIIGSDVVAPSELLADELNLLPTNSIVQQPATVVVNPPPSTILVSPPQPPPPAPAAAASHKRKNPPPSPATPQKTLTTPPTKRRKSVARTESSEDQAVDLTQD